MDSPNSIEASPPCSAPARSAKISDGGGPIGAALIVAGGLTAVSAAMRAADPVTKLAPWPPMTSFAVGSLIFAVGCWLSAGARPWRWIADWPGRRVQPGQPSAWLLRALPPALALAAVAGVTWWWGKFQTPAAILGALSWLAALLLIIITLAIPKRLPQPTIKSLIPWALFLLALIPRAYDNADLPYGVWYDEAEAGLQARKFLETWLYTPISDTYGRDASLFYYLISIAQAFVGDPVLAGRLVAAIVGAACAPLIYFLGRELFGWQVGVVAGIVLASLRWHLNVSRLGWDPISLPFCAILFFWLLARVVRTGSFIDATWAGLALGLGMHGYIGFRALPPVGLIMLLYGGWIRQWPLRAWLGRVGAVLGAAALSALPIIVFAAHDPTAFNSRIDQVLILKEHVSLSQAFGELLSNLQKHLLMFHISGDLNGRHNLPGLPMLDPLSGLFMMLGLAILILRPFDWRSLLLFGWAASSMTGGILTLSFEAPQGMRTLGVTPALALLVALGLVVIVDRAAALTMSSPVSVTVLTAVAGSAVLLISAANLGTFFGAQMHNPIVWESFSTRETILARAARQSPGQYEAILGSQTIAPSLQIRLMVPSIQNSIRALDASSDLPYRGHGPALIVLESEHDAALADEFARYYPDAHQRLIVPPQGGTPIARELVLDSGAIAAHRRLAAGHGSDRSWRAILVVDQSGFYGFRPSPDVQVTIDGALVHQDERVRLARGNHILIVRGVANTAQPPDLTWRPPGVTTWQPIDDRALFIGLAGGNGLQATFYPSANWNGSPTDTMIDPLLAHYYHINPLSRLNLSPPLWSVEWRGFIDVPLAGTYRFDVERTGRAGMWIDETPIFDETTEGRPRSQAGVAELASGRHQLRVRLQNRQEHGPRLYLYWTPPGGNRALLPGRVLYAPFPLSPRSDVR